MKISTGNGLVAAASLTSLTPTQILDVGGAVTVTAAEGPTPSPSAVAPSVDVGVLVSKCSGTSTLDFNGGTTTIAGSVTHTHLAGTSNTNFNATSITITGAST